MQKKRKVVFLVPSLTMGGLERVLVNYANLFAKRDYEVTVLNFTSDDPAIVNYLDKNIIYHRCYIPVPHLFHAKFKDIIKLNFRLLPWEKWMKLHSSNYLHKKYLVNQYDIEVAFSGRMTLKIICGSNDSRVTKLGWIHGGFRQDLFEPLGEKQTREIYKNVEKFICVSQDARNTISRVFNRSEKTYVVNNPNDSFMIRRLGDEAINLDCNVFTFVSVVRFDEKQKKILRIIEAAQKLNLEGYSYQIWLIGDGNDYAMIHAKSDSYHLDNVFFLGKQENPYKFVKKADMYLCSSLSEGFSMSMMEAVILATPMLTTDVSGAEEMLDGGKYGMIVENSEAGLYEGMKKILSDKALYNHYKKMAELRKDYLSEEIIMDEVERIINE